MVKEYSKEEVTVTWEPVKYINSGWTKINAVDKPFCDVSHKKPDFQR